MNPKPGVFLNPVSPACPKETYEADSANPGEAVAAKIEQQKTKTGKYGNEPIHPFKPNGAGSKAPSSSLMDENEEELSWIEVELLSQGGKPVPGERYFIRLPDERVAEGTLDENGFVRLDSVVPGLCEICFPDLNKDVWEPV